MSKIVKLNFKNKLPPHPKKRLDKPFILNICSLVIIETPPNKSSYGSLLKTFRNKITKIDLF